MMWRNLNAFFAALALGSLAVGPAVMLLTYMVTLAGADVRIGFLFIPLVTFSLVVLLAYTWWKRGLVPKSIRHDRQRQNVYGHCLVVIGNTLTFAPLTGVMVLYAIGWSGWRPAFNADQRLFEKIMPWVAPTGLVLLIFGLALIFTSRGAISHKD